MMKTNAKRKNSAVKKLIPAAGMLALSASMLATSTYAWFAMNKTVSISGMELKATAENGIVITNETPSTTGWKNSVTASHDGKYTPSGGSATSLGVRPISTADATTWYHNISNDIDDANAIGSNAYTSPTILVDSTTGAGYVDDDGITPAAYDPATDSNYYLKNTFYIKSSQAQDITSNVLQVVKCKATAGSNSADLDKAFRVAVVTGSATYIFAPVSGADTTYGVNGSNTNLTNITAPADASTGVVSVDTAVTTIPNNTATIDAANSTPQAVRVDVYLYFEGEDANCKSTNLKATLDTISVELGFGLKNNVNNG